jgi:hypothetical protein
MHNNSITRVIHKIKQLKQQRVRLNFKFQVICLTLEQYSLFHGRERITDEIHEKQKRNHKERKNLHPIMIPLCSFSLLKKNENLLLSLSRKPPHYVQDDPWQFS